MSQQALSAILSKGGLPSSGFGLGDLGNYLSMGLGAIGSARAAKKAYKYQRELMAYQYQLTRKLNQNAYQDTTSSMRNSGINPMLAITQGINGLSAGSGGSVNVQNPVEAGVNTAAARSAIKNERMLAQSSYENAMSSAYKLNADEAYIRDQNAAFNEFNPQIQKATLEQIKAHTANIEANTSDAYNQIKNRDRLTTSQIDANSAGSYYNRHRALGYSESKSGSGNLGASAFGFSGNLGGSYSHSKGW